MKLSILLASLLGIVGPAIRLEATVLSPEFRPAPPGSVIQGEAGWANLAASGAGSNQVLVVQGSTLTRVNADGTVSDPVPVRVPGLSEVLGRSATAVAGNGASYLWLRCNFGLGPSAGIDFVRVPQEGPLDGLTATVLAASTEAAECRAVAVTALTAGGGDFLAAWLQGSQVVARRIPAGAGELPGPVQGVAEPGLRARSVAVAASGAECLLVWAGWEPLGGDTNRHTVQGLRVSADGVPLEPVPRVLAQVTNRFFTLPLSVAGTAAGYAVAWSGGVRVVGVDGVPTSPEVPVPETAVPAHLSFALQGNRDWEYQPQVAAFGDGWVLGYVPVTNSSVYRARKLEPGGGLGPEIPVREELFVNPIGMAALMRPQLSALGASLLVVYGDSRLSESSLFRTYAAWATRFDLGGPLPREAVHGFPFSYRASVEGKPVLVPVPGGVLALWEDDRSERVAVPSNRIHRSVLRWNGTTVVPAPAGPVEAPDNGYRVEGAVLEASGTVLLSRRSHPEEPGDHTLRRLGPAGEVTASAPFTMGRDFFGFNPFGSLFGPRVAPVGSHLLVVAAGVDFDFRGPAFSVPHVHARVYSPDLSVVTDAPENPLAIGQGGLGVDLDALRVAGNDRGALVLWGGGDQGRGVAGPLGLFLGPDGKPAAVPPFRPPSSWSRMDVASDGTNFLVAGLGESPEGMRVEVIRVGTDGGVSEMRSVVLPAGAVPSMIRVFGFPGAYGVVVPWERDGGQVCHLQRIQADGEPVGGMEPVLAVGPRALKPAGVAVHRLADQDYLLLAETSTAEGSAGLRGVVVSFGAVPALVYANPVPDLAATRGEPFAYVVPGNAFQHTNAAAAIRLEVSGLPPGVGLDAAARRLEGVPTQVGEFTVVLKASDESVPPRGATGSFRVRVQAPTILNRPPVVVGGLALPPMRYGQPMGVSLPPGLFVDPDPGQTLAWSVSGLPDGVVFALPGSLVGLPRASGVFEVVLVATDNGTPPMSARLTLPLTVAKAPLTITARDTSAPAGGALPPLEVAYAGLVLGDTAAVFESPVTVTTTATPQSPPGTYPITVGGATARDYLITFVPGTLTLTGSVPLTVEWAAGATGIRLQFTLAAGQRAALEQSSDLSLWEVASTWEGPRTVETAEAYAAEGQRFWRVRLLGP